MPVIEADIKSSLNSKLKSKLTIKYKKLTPEMIEFIDVISSSVAEVMVKTLTIDAIVNGGICTPGGAITGGKIQ